MQWPDRPPGPGSFALALSILSSPVRLRIIEVLRTPKTLKEIEVQLPAEADEAGASSRNIARQTVKVHLEKLMEVGVIFPREAQRAYGPTSEYVLNHQTLFALSEEFREFARIRSSAEPGQRTVHAEAEGPFPELKGPCLVLVKGLQEGRVFRLVPVHPRRQEWGIGRRRGIDVSLDFDPFVSSDHARVVWEEGRHFVEDLPTNRNGTLVNFRPLAKGARASLAQGDLVGVGRSILMFRQ